MSLHNILTVYRKELRDSLRPLQDIEQVRAHRDRLAKGLIAEPQQFAVRLVVAHDVLQRVNAFEGGSGGGLGRGSVGSVEREGEERAHRGVLEFESVKRLR